MENYFSVNQDGNFTISIGSVENQFLFLYDWRNHKETKLKHKMENIIYNLIADFENNLVICGDVTGNVSIQTIFQNKKEYLLFEQNLVLILIKGKYLYMLY